MTNEDLKELWKKRITNYRKSGKTQVEWCKENNLNHRTFSTWIKREKEGYFNKNNSVKKEEVTKWATIDVKKKESTPIILKVKDVAIKVTDGYNKNLLIDILNIVKSL